MIISDIWALVIALHTPLKIVDGSRDRANNDMVPSIFASVLCG